MSLAIRPHWQHARLSLRDGALINDLLSSYVTLPPRHLVRRSSKLHPGPEVASVRRVTQILVIEDDRDIRDLLRSVLSDEGYELVIVDRPERAAADAAPDLIITDLVGLHGYESGIARASIGHIQQRYPATPIMVLTAHEEAIVELDRLGAAAVLRKPFTIEDLVETVARLTVD